MAHLTREQRYTIYVLRKKNVSLNIIAKTISKYPSVVSREIKRNSDKRNGEYRYDLAHRKYLQRLNTKKKDTRFTPVIQCQIESLLREDYSPEQVVGSLKRDNIETVSTERIYQHIWQDKRNGGDLYKHLRRKGRRYRKRANQKDSRGRILNRVSISQRPKQVDDKLRFGDLEVDLIMGKNHKQSILTINDRASGMLRMKKLPNKEAKTVSMAMIKLLEPWSPYLKTITADNGKEFAQHQMVSEQLDIEYYFADPYSPWQRGANENLNGLIRQYFPKSSDFSCISEQQIQQVQDKLNNRPRKRFNFRKPIFVMNQLLFNPKIAFAG